MHSEARPVGFVRLFIVAKNNMRPLLSSHASHLLLSSFLHPVSNGIVFMQLYKTLTKSGNIL